jgi:hypothetical protein
MDVIPLTLAISLLLSLTFIALFVREFSRPRRAGADRDSLLPLEQEMSIASLSIPAAAPRTAARSHAADLGHGHAHDHAHDHPETRSPDGSGRETCAGKRADGRCCSSCQRRRDRAAAKAAESAPTAANPSA